MNSTLVFLFLMMVWSSTASLFTNETTMFLTSTATNETIAKVKELGKYCEYPGNLNSRPRLYEPGWWCVVGATCIPLSKICNGIFDCKDYHKSDERMACNLYPDTGKYVVIFCTSEKFHNSKLIAKNSCFLLEYACTM